MSCRSALDSGVQHVLVVLGAEATQHKKSIEISPVEIVFNEDWKKGMGNSLKKGMQYVINHYPETEAVIIMVCDQPYLTASHLKDLVARYQEGSVEIVASVYNQTKGVPALFSKNLFNQLLSLDDAQGARKIIGQHSGSTISIPFERGEIDIDTPDDLKKIQS